MKVKGIDAMLTCLRSWEEDGSPSDQYGFSLNHLRVLAYIHPRRAGCQPKELSLHIGTSLTACRYVVKQLLAAEYLEIAPETRFNYILSRYGEALLEDLCNSAIA